MAKKKKPAHEVIIRMIINEFNNLMKIEKSVKVDKRDILSSSPLNIYVGLEIINVLLVVLDRMVIPDKPLAEFVDAMELPGYSLEPVAEIVEQLKKLCPVET